MLVVQNAAQPALVRNAVVDLIAADTDQVRIAAAYVTQSGYNMMVAALRNALNAAAFAAMPKLLITAFDFGLTEPAALQAWSELPNAVVRVSGSERMLQGSLMPARAFHPKVYAFGRPDGSSGVMVGSANLTGRAFSVNTEAVWAHLLPTDEVDPAFQQAEHGTVPLLDHHLAAYAALRQAHPAPAQVAQEVMPVEPPAAVDLAALPQFRAAIETGQVNPDAYDRLWVHGESLQGGSRNQLELPRESHRFFNFAFNDYDNPNKVTIGEVTLRVGARVWHQRLLTWHGDNKMERFNLPTVAQGGYNYANSAVMFRRMGDGSFEIIVTPWDADLANAWRQASADRGLLFRLGGAASNRVVGLL